MTSVADSLRVGAEILQNAAVPDAIRQASSLLQFATGRDRTFIIAHPEYVLTETEDDSFRKAIARRAAREPFQHIVGHQEFYGLDFIVTPNVLIPRPETELIVERAIELLSVLPSPRFLEIGIGSGCIAVAILKHCPNASALAVDISEAAVKVARRNAEIHELYDRLQMLQSDIFESVNEETFDLIVSNPPYVPLAQYDGLQPEVRDHDPRVALTDGSTGLTIIERIIVGAPEFLQPAGRLLMEIGFGQNEHVEGVFDPATWESVSLIHDLQGIPRIVDAALA
ncbi:MAG: peptide chain release factor N(5)-glutamine methyltransferase [bacterium]|nr:peptide chain release factor N(5)-glutamine methyltransferase [bacterium]